MSKECRHEYHAINPFQRICCICNDVVNVVHLKNYSQKEFQEMYSQNPEPTDPIVFKAPPDLSK